MPIFWLALILQLVFFQRLHWLPVAGEYALGPAVQPPAAPQTGFPVIDALLSGNWPMLGSSLRTDPAGASWSPRIRPALIARMVRAQVLDMIGETHMQMARALGFGERHDLRPVRDEAGAGPRSPPRSPWCSATRWSTRSWWSRSSTGRGSAAMRWRRSSTLDTPAILGVTLFVAVAYVFANLVVDIVQAAIDPRIRLR